MVVGGLTVLERRVRELSARGVRRVTVIAAPIDLPPIAKIDVTFAPSAVAPDGDVVERADELAGIVIEDDASRSRAEWALLRRMNKSFEGPVDALINSKVSMRITRLLARTPLTPNHVTLFAFLIGLVACEFVRRGTYWPAAIGGVLMELNSILDSCDGELARLRYQFSKFGQWLDNVSDDVVDNVFIVCAGLGAGGPWAWLGIAAAVARTMVAVATYWIVHKKTGTGDVFAFRYWFEQDKETADEVYELTSIAAWIRSFGRRDTYVFGWMLLCLSGLSYGVVVWGVVIALINVPMFVAHLVATTAAGAIRARAATADVKESVGRD
jgi:phosphatidylglycerophosphate synthase